MGPQSSVTTGSIAWGHPFLAAAMHPATSTALFRVLLPTAILSFEHFMLNSEEIFTAEDLNSTYSNERLARLNSMMMTWIISTDFVVGRSRSKQGYDLKGSGLLPEVKHLCYRSLVVGYHFSILLHALANAL